MPDKQDFLIGCFSLIGVVVIFLAILVAALGARALVVMLAWNWIAPHVISTLPTITFWGGLGAMMIAQAVSADSTSSKLYQLLQNGYLTSPSESGEKRRLYWAVNDIAITPLFTLVLAYVVHLFLT